MVLIDRAPADETERLEELVVAYAQASDLTLAPWLTDLRLEQPRRNLRCLSAVTRWSKRTVDVVGSLALLAMLWPVMLAAALAVAATSPGPIIFRQRRVGLNLRNTDRRSGADDDRPEVERRSGQRRGARSYGRHFTLYKFRTMRTDAESDGAQFAQTGDPRVTTVGRFMRRTRIDELPQLWNVLRGDMSLVGPRPERPEFMEHLSRSVPGFLDRLGLKPGLTGLAQVVNGYDNEMEGFRRKVALDLLYLQNCCLTNDCKIMLRTVGVVLTGKGAL